jgi:hypothetical protein
MRRRTVRILLLAPLVAVVLLYLDSFAVWWTMKRAARAACDGDARGYCTARFLEDPRMAATATPNPSSTPDEFEHVRWIPKYDPRHPLIRYVDVDNGELGIVMVRLVWSLGWKIDGILAWG